MDMTDTPNHARPSSMKTDWTPVVDLVEKLTALAMTWERIPARQECAEDLQAVLSGSYDPRIQPDADATEHVLQGSTHFDA